MSKVRVSLLTLERMNLQIFGYLFDMDIKLGLSKNNIFLRTFSKDIFLQFFKFSRMCIL